jgi:hypothetical protein
VALLSLSALLLLVLFLQDKQCADSKLVELHELLAKHRR